MMGNLPLRRRVGLLFLVLVLVLLGGGGGADAGVTSSYRRKLEATVEMPLDADVFRVPPGYNAPQQVRYVRRSVPVPDQIPLPSWPLASFPSHLHHPPVSTQQTMMQVHITLGDQEGTAMIVSWVTPSELGNTTVAFGEHPDPEKMERRAEGTHTRYDYFNYTSGFIHHCTLKNLKVGCSSQHRRSHPICICYAILLMAAPPWPWMTTMLAARHQVLLRHGVRPHGEDLLLHHAAQAGP
jgi:hypothetical protein